MKTEEEIEKMYRLIGQFNDGNFMNQDYRRGIIDALSFVLHPAGSLENMVNKIIEIIDVLKYKEDDEDANKS